MEKNESTSIRLNKFLASCGIGSRRACDQMIQDGLVTVNGCVEVNPAVRVSATDFVKINEKRVQSLQTETILINKPKGLVCSKHDELNRETIYSLIPPKYQHLNHVGRLDKESEGLLILTNDGNLAQGLTHPSKKIEKEYIVTVNQAFDNEILNRFLKGVPTPEGKAQAKSVKRLSPRRVRIVLETGLKRQIRMMFQSCNIVVAKLVRVRIGNLQAPDLENGKYRVLEKEDQQQLFSKPAIDKKATTLQSQQLRRNRKKPQKNNKDHLPLMRSHDGVSASDRLKPKTTKSPTREFDRKTTKTPQGKRSSGSRSPLGKKSTRGFNKKHFNSRSPLKKQSKKDEKS